MIQQAKTYADQMLALKQIRALPDFATLLRHQVLRRGRQAPPDARHGTAAPHRPALPGARRLLGLLVPAALLAAWWLATRQRDTA